MSLFWHQILCPYREMKQRRRSTYWSCRWRSSSPGPTVGTSVWGSLGTLSKAPASVHPSILLERPAGNLLAPCAVSIWDSLSILERQESQRPFQPWGRKFHIPPLLLASFFPLFIFLPRLHLKLLFYLRTHLERLIRAAYALKTPVSFFIRGYSPE